MLDKGDDVRSMAAAGALNMVGVNCAVLESCGSLINKAGFVEGITMKFALNVVLITDPALPNQYLQRLRRSILTSGKCRWLLVYSPSLHAISELQLPRCTARANRVHRCHYPSQLCHS